MSDLKLLLKEQEIDEIERQEYESILQEIEQLKSIQTDLKCIIDEQSDDINLIKNDIEQVDINVEIGVKALKKARLLNTKYIPVYVGMCLGAIVGGPIGAAAGLKSGLVIAGVTAGSGIVGGGIGYGLQK